MEKVLFRDEFDRLCNIAMEAALTVRSSGYLGGNIDTKVLAATRAVLEELGFQLPNDPDHIVPYIDRRSR
jgi:hypothetical protein